MKIEQNYDFLKRFRVIHQPGRRRKFHAANPDEIQIDSSWWIRLPENLTDAESRTAYDFQDYLQRSMGISLPVNCERCGKAISFRNIPKKHQRRGAFEITISEDLVTVSGDDERGVLRGGVYLEDLMNLEEGPYLKRGSFRKEPILKMRLIHSGSGIDDFPDWQLNAILHAGFTAVDVFVRDIDTNAKKEYCNINDLIERAESFGLDTILYNYMKCFKHPDDPDADAALDALYGNLFRHYPKAAGISLVGESLEFPSRDERTTGKRYNESVVDGIPDPRPSPGWFPCRDYPALLSKIVLCIHNAKPDANIVFSTYNWSYLSKPEREDFLARCPKELTINIAFEMQKQRVMDGVRFPVMDYSASVTEPGDYFVSECEGAYQSGLKIRVCSNTGGNAWDFGAVPYIPVPQLWLKRMRALLPYALHKGADCFYEGHHYGWWPNIANDLMKKMYLSPENPIDDELFLKQLAVRDYGTDEVVRVWQYWSEALTHAVTSNEDQYGPLRVGSAYPFVFQVNISRTMLPKEIPFPCAPHAMFGNAIIKTLYQPYENTNQSSAIRRYPIDIKELEKLIVIWTQGCELLDSLLLKMPAGRKRENGEYLRALGGYILHSEKTVLHIKQWYLTNMKLRMCVNPDEAEMLLNQLIAIVEEESANVQDTIPYVEKDSRLGWEPSMEYVCDRSHLEWKLRQLNFALKEIEQYRKIIR